MNDTAAIRCPVHRLWPKVRGSRLVRLVRTANLTVLKLARDQVDRRLVRLREIEASVQRKRG